MNSDKDKDDKAIDAASARSDWKPYPRDIVWPTENDIPLMAYAPLPKNFIAYVQKYYRQYPDTVIGKVREALDTVNDCACTTVIAGGTMEVMDAIVKATRLPGEDPVKTKFHINVILNPEYLNLAPCCTLRILTHYGSVPEIGGGYTPFTNQDRIVGWEVMNQPHFWDWGDTLALRLTGKPGSDYVWNRLTMGYGMTTSMDHYYEAGGTPSDSAPKRLSWFNLAAVPDKTANPSAALTDCLGNCKTYKEYLKVLDRLFRPRVWSYSYFPFMNTLDSNGNVTGLSVNLEEFYRYLTLFRDRVNNPEVTYEKPSNLFWNYAMTIEHRSVDASGRTEWSRPAPTVGMLRFEAFNALAFGAKGIVYFQYGSTYSDATGGARYIYGTAPLSCTIPDTGVNAKITFHKSAVWEAIKTVNQEINSWKSVFMDSRVMDCYRTGPVITGVAPLPDKFYCINSLQTNAKGVIVSHLKRIISREGSSNLIVHYIVLVNRDYENDQYIKASLDSSYSAQFMMPRPGLNPVDPSDSALAGPPVVIGPSNQKKLSPGGIAVITWNEK